MVRFLAALALIGQLPEPIRVTTQLVEVNVVVRDKNGPVAGLRAEDFVLRDRGRVQKIAVFRTSEIRSERKAVPPGEFTNRVFEDSQHAVVIVWDHLNTDFGDAAVARRQALKALEQIQTHDRVCLYVLDSELRVIQDFTSDSRLLVSALRKYREERLDRPVDVPLLSGSPAGDPRVAEMYEAINATVTAKALAYRMPITAAAVRAIANHMASVPGRKSVIWIAGEVPAATAALGYAGIAVYPVDLSGTSSSTPRLSQNEKEIARQSGGIASIHSDLRSAIDRAVKDSEASYTLGFYPDRTPGWTNALKIEMKVKGLDAGYHKVYAGVASSSAGRERRLRTR